MREKVAGYTPLAQALRTFIYKLELRYDKKLSQSQIAAKIGVSPNNFKSWINSYKQVNIAPQNIRLLMSFFYIEGLFAKNSEFEEMVDFWRITNQKVPFDESFIRDLLQNSPNSELLQKEEELKADVYTPIDILTQYLPDAARQPIENFLDTYLVGTKDQPAFFGGRKTDLEFLNDWLNNSQSHPPYLLLYGPTGRGKSALLAHWASQLTNRQDLIVVFLPISLRYGTDYETFFLRALAGCFTSLYGEKNTESFIYKSSLDELRAFITKKLKEPIPGGQQLVIILDGIDEAKDWEFNAANLFPYKTIPGLHIIVSTRTYVDETESQDWLARVGWHSGLAQEMELDLLFEEDITDLLIQQALPLIQPSTEEALAKILYRLSEGEPLLVNLYAKELLDPHTRFNINQIHPLDEPMKSICAQKVLSILGSMGSKEEDQKFQADMFDLLVPHLSEPLLQKAQTIALAIPNKRYKIRALTALMSRLPEMDIITEILNIIPTINFRAYGQWQPAHILLKLAPYYQAKSLIDEAFKWAENATETHFPQVLLELLPYMIKKKDPKVGSKLEEALRIACNLGEQYRGRILAQLAPYLVNALETDRLYGVWSNALHLLSEHKRDRMLEDESRLMPVMLEITGTEAGDSICNAVITVGQWWQ